MPLPLAIPAIAAFFGSLFTSLVTVFAQYVAKKIALIAAVILAITATTALFVAALWGVKQGLTVAFPGGYMSIAFAMLPSNTDICVAAIGAAKLAKYVYVWNVRVIQYKLF